LYNYRLSILVLISAALITISLFISQPLRASTKELETNNLPIVLDPSLKVEVVVKGLDKPTQMAFLGNDDFLVLEKNQGTVRRVINNTLLNEPVIDVKVATAMERGLLGLAISKNHYASDNKSNAENNNSTKIFLFFTESKEDGNDHCPHITYCVPGNDPLGNRLYSYDLEGNHAVNPHLLLDLPATPGADHIGGVIKIGPDKNLYLVSGDGDSCADISSNYKMIYRCKGNNLEGSVLKISDFQYP
jgi:Glucose/sorbosone dehydrogenases